MKIDIRLYRHFNSGDSPRYILKGYTIGEVTDKTMFMRIRVHNVLKSAFGDIKICTDLSMLSRYHTYMDCVIDLENGHIQSDWIGHDVEDLYK